MSLPDPDRIQRLDTLRVRVAEAEMTAYVAAAAKVGVTLSTWVRRVLRAAVEASGR